MYVSEFLWLITLGVIGAIIILVMTAVTGLLFDKIVDTAHCMVDLIKNG
jgi:hypothetical protein